MVASLYGFSGASSDKGCEADNESVIGAAIFRMQQLGRIPYFLLTDLNTDPEHFQCLVEARRAGIAFDIGSDLQGGEPKPTHNANRDVYEGMDGRGVTRIDTIIGNEAASAVASDAGNSHVGCRGYDHAAVHANTGKIR